MTAAVLKSLAVAKPAFAKPSYATLRKIETVLAVVLAAQTVGLVIRYAL